MIAAEPHPARISASCRYYRQDITNERFTLNEDSTMDAPRRPCWGVT